MDGAAHRKDGDSYHLPVAALRTLQWIVPGELLPPFPVVTCRLRDWHGHNQQFPAPVQVLRAVAVAEKAIVADALKRIRENMQQEAPQELVSRHGHHLVPLLVFVVLIGETDLPVLESFQPVVGDGDTMGIAAQVIEDSARAVEWRLGVDHPFTVMERRQLAGEAFGI